jgi:hypothetical protein
LPLDAPEVLQGAAVFGLAPLAPDPQKPPLRRHDDSPDFCRQRLRWYRFSGRSQSVHLIFPF